MKIGILQCDDVNAELKDEHGNYEQMFISLFTSIDSSLEFHVYRVMDGQYPTDIDACDAYITTGSRYSVNDDIDWIIELQRFIETLYRAKKKLIGVCFGHQMIAKALGGQVALSALGWGVGVATSQWRITPPWSQGMTADMSLLVSHKEQVVSLPPGAKTLAGSDFCPYAVMQIDDHVVGLQGHPEFSPSYAKHLVNARKASIPKPTLQAGIKSLTRPLDANRLALCLLAFMRD